MLEELGKNLWLLLTLIMPGLFTYGAWRIILLMEPSQRLAAGVLDKIDSSVLITTSIIVAIALLQQAVSIAVEAGLTLLANVKKNEWPGFHALFRGRFALAATNKLSENATRVVGNFFLSTNMCAGLGLLLAYCLLYEKMPVTDWVPIGLMALLSAGLIAAVFRMFNAMWVIAECGKDDANKPALRSPEATA